MDDNVQLAFLPGFEEASVTGLLDNFSKLCILIYFYVCSFRCNVYVLSWLTS